MKPHWIHHMTTRAPFHISPIISYNSFQVQSTSCALEYFLCFKWNQPISHREQKFQTLNSSYHSNLSELSPGPNHSVSITHNTDSSAFFLILTSFISSCSYHCLWLSSSCFCFAVFLFIVLPPSTFSMPQSPTFPVPQNMFHEVGEKRSGVALSLAPKSVP